MFQFLAPKMEPTPGYFPMRLGRGTDLRVVLKTWKNDLLPFPYIQPISSQQLLNPQYFLILSCRTCNLQAIGVLGLSECSLPSLWVGQFNIKLFSFPHRTLPLMHFGGHCPQAGGLKSWGFDNTPAWLASLSSVREGTDYFLHSPWNNLSLFFIFCWIENLNVSMVTKAT